MLSMFRKVGPKKALMLASALSIGATGCAIAGSDDYKQTGVKPITEKLEPTDLLPFRVAFQLDGTMVILTEEGKPIETRPAKFPIETTKIYDLKNFSIGFIQGSCEVLTSGGSTISIGDVPESVCKRYQLYYDQFR